MKLKRLFTSNTRVKLLTIFLMNPEEEFFIRELTRRLDEQINSIRRELDNLKKLGLLKSRTKNRKKYYLINSNFAFLPELTSIFTKSVDQNEEVVKSIEKMGEVDFLLLSGHFLRKNAAIDLLIVGEIERKSLEDYLEKEVNSEESIRFTLMNREDFLYRVKCNDKFIKDLVVDSGNLIAVNNLQDALN